MHEWRSLGCRARLIFSSHAHARVAPLRLEIGCLISEQICRIFRCHRLLRWYGNIDLNLVHSRKSGYLRPEVRRRRPHGGKSTVYKSWWLPAIHSCIRTRTILQTAATRFVVTGGKLNMIQHNGRYRQDALYSTARQSSAMQWALLCTAAVSISSAYSPRPSRVGCNDGHASSFSTFHEADASVILDHLGLPSVQDPEPPRRVLR